MIAKLRLIPALVVVAGLACSATAIAQPNGRAWGWGQNRVGSQAAYDNGYRAGYDQGQADARGRDRYGYERHGRYRSGDLGYDSRYGNRNDYRQSFRQGFAVGYEQGYNGSGRYGNGRATPRRDPGYGNRYPTYPTGRGDYGGYGGYGGSGGGYYSEAYDRGLREGSKKGREDAKDGDRYDPRRHKWYREGDRGYNSRDGSREQYKAAYRDAFERGYADGYRQYGGRGSYGSNGGWRWPW
jgi:hypothetical protein